MTPHFLHPPPPDSEITDGHMLTVGINNLGFCGVDRRAGPFLEWWWGHLREECLCDPLSGLFVDQKWVDLGGSLFQAASFRHAGYNVGVANLSERELEARPEGYFIASTGEPLRLFHFHAFDSSAPEKLSLRFRHEGELDKDDSVVLQLCKEYAEVLISFEQSLPPAPPYPYWTDTSGRRIARQIRHAYQRDLLSHGESLPSPFLQPDAAAYDRWRRKAWGPVARGLMDRAAKCVRLVLPEEWESVKKRFPKLSGQLTDRFSGGSGIWGQ